MKGIYQNKTEKSSRRWKRILLIMPNYRMPEANRFIQRIYPPIGLMYLASYLKDLDIEIKIIDAKIDNLTFKQLKDQIYDYNPDLVGISVSVSASIKMCYNIAKIVKNINENITVVFGGRHASNMPDEILKLDNLVDIIVRGEGELTFRELILSGNPKNVDGISYKHNDSIIHNPNRDLIKNMNLLRYPTRNLINPNKYKLLGIRIDTVQSSRGCTHDCKFCTTPGFNNGLWRPRSVDSVIKELKLISKNRKITDIIFVDDNFCASTLRIERLCEKIIECKKKNEINDFKFYAQIRVDSITKSPQMVKKMSEAGFWAVLIGIESVNDEILKDMRKKITFTQVISAIKLLHYYNIIIFGSMIIGYDLNATEEDIIKEIDFIKKIDIDFPIYSLITPFPGTPIFDEFNKKKLITTKDWSRYTPFKPVIKTYKLSSEKLFHLLHYAFKKHAYYKNFIRFIPRIFKTRSSLFIYNPIRIVTTIITILKTSVFVKKHFNEIKN